MSIRPVDYSTMLPKTQEVSKAKQIEFDKTKIQLEQGHIQQEHKIERNKNRINNTNKSEFEKINIKKDRNKKEHGNDDNERKNKGETNKKNNAKIEGLGDNIDIRI